MSVRLSSPADVTHGHRGAENPKPAASVRFAFADTLVVIINTVILMSV